MTRTPERPERASSLISEPQANAFPVHPSAVSSCPASASTPRVAPGGEPETKPHPWETLRASKPAIPYLLYFPSMREVARQHGYALALHGSLTRDFDLIAAAWTPEASDADTLVEAICAANQLLVTVPDKGDKPHGRRCWTLQGIADVPHGWVDLAVFPPQPTVTALDSRLATAEQRAKVLAEDLEIAAGECLVPVPEPGTDLSRVLLANRQLARHRDTAEASRARAEQERDAMREALTIADEWFGGCDCITTETGTDERKTRYWALRATQRHPERPDATATEGRPESVDLAVDQGARTAQRLPSRSSPNAVSPDPAIASALRPDETPRSASTADLDQRDRALER
jgi:hypothetical protein